MSIQAPRIPRLTDSDLDLVAETVAPDAADKATLKTLVQEDESFRRGMVGDERLFRRVMDDEEMFIRLSPSLYFEILFRQALTELQNASHTVERAGTETIVVFDTPEVVRLLGQEPVLYYLADMLSSFTKINSYVVPVRVKPRVWRRIRFNDMDVDSLIRFAQGVEEENRFGLYKRIADVCLLVLGLFPEFAQRPLSRGVRPQASWRSRRGVQEYEEEGRRFYGLAGEHPAARSSEMAEVFSLLRENFVTARKPLNFIAQHYLRHRRGTLFSTAPES